jgi:hypothetical protein
LWLIAPFALEGEGGPVVGGFALLPEFELGRSQGGVGCGVDVVFKVVVLGGILLMQLHQDFGFELVIALDGGEIRGFERIDFEFAAERFNDLNCCVDVL